MRKLLGSSKKRSKKRKSQKEASSAPLKIRPLSAGNSSVPAAREVVVVVVVVQTTTVVTTGRILAQKMLAPTMMPLCPPGFFGKLMWQRN